MNLAVIIVSLCVYLPQFYTTFYPMRNTFLLAALFITALISCQKEHSTENGFLPNGQTNTSLLNDSNTLLRYVDLDTTLAVGADTLDKDQYSYDNAHRLVRSDYIEYNGASPDNISTTVLYYNSADTLPYKKRETRTLVGTGVVTNDQTLYFNYVNGRISYDSLQTVGSPYTLAYSFTYQSDRIIETNTDYSVSPPLTTTHNIYFVKNNGNTVLQIDTASGSAYYHFTFTYDNKNNPFHNMPQAFVERSRPYYMMETYPEEMVSEKNNPTDINETLLPSIFHFKYFYTYRANGYPSIARAYDQDDPTIFFKRIFTYTNLP